MLKRMLVWVAVGILLAFAGGCCSTVTSEEAKAYKQASSHLQPGGTYYKISSQIRMNKWMEELFRGFELSLASPSGCLDPQIATELQRISAVFAVCWELAGVNELLAYGASSMPLGGDSPLMENRVFLALPPQPNGVLWKLSGDSNFSLRDEFRALPLDTVFAADMSVNLEAVTQALKPLQETTAQANELSESLFKTPMDKFLKGISGDWSILVTADDGASIDTLDGIRVLLTLPDADGKFFHYLEGLAQLIPGTVVENNRVMLGSLKNYGVVWRPELHFDDGRIYIYSSKDMIDELAQSDAPLLVDTPEFGRMVEGLPEEGYGFVYVGGGMTLLRRAIAERIGMESAAVLSQFDHKMLMVLRNEPDGKLAVSHGNWDLNQVEFVEGMLFPMMVLTSAFTPYLDARRNQLDDKAALEQCGASLRGGGKGLVKYADEHAGNFPKDNGIMGLKELLATDSVPLSAMVCPASDLEVADNLKTFTLENCSYLYLGGYTKKSNPKLPLLIDLPENHNDAVNVVLVSGEVVTLNLENPECCRRVVSYMHTIYHYSESEFKELMSKATALDKQYKLD